MLSNLAAVIGVGGLPVLFSYFIISRVDENRREVLISPLGGFLWPVWLVFMCLTIISYFFLAWTFIWGVSDNNGKIFNSSAEEIEPWLCVIYTLFLANAGQWGYIALHDIFYAERSWYIVLNLWATALLTITIMAFAIGVNDVPLWIDVISTICGIIIALHHLVLDAIIWLMSFEPTSYNAF